MRPGRSSARRPVSSRPVPRAPEARVCSKRSSRSCVASSQACNPASTSRASSTAPNATRVAPRARKEASTTVRKNTSLPRTSRAHDNLATPEAPMIPRRTSSRAAALLLALAPCLALSGADDAAARRQEAESLYAAGHYGQALSVLEAIDAAGQASGPLLYRLAFCQREAGKAAEAQATEARALENLERELESAKTLE